MKKILFLALFCSFLTSFAGGGWPQEDKGYFIKLGQYSILAGYYFAPSGEIIEITSTGFHSTSLYFEYGITSKLTLIANMPFFVRSTLNETRDTNGNLISEGDYVNSFGDTDVSLKYGFARFNGWAMAATLTAGLPLGKSSAGQTGLLQTGDGEFNQLVSVDVGRGLNKGYFNFYMGFNNRTNSFSDEFRYGIEGGRKLGDLWAILRISGIESFMNGNAEFVQTNGLFSNNVEFLAISPEFSYEFKNRIGISLGAGFAAKGRNVLANPSFMFGVYIKS